MSMRSLMHTSTNEKLVRHKHKGEACQTQTNDRLHYQTSNQSHNIQLNPNQTITSTFATNPFHPYTYLGLSSSIRHSVNTSLPSIELVDCCEDYKQRKYQNKPKTKKLASLNLEFR
jgi:hypothetical protein